MKRFLFGVIIGALLIGWIKNNPSGLKKALNSDNVPSFNASTTAGDIFSNITSDDLFAEYVP